MCYRTDLLFFRYHDEDEAQNKQNQNCDDTHQPNDDVAHEMTFVISCSRWHTR